MKNDKVKIFVSSKTFGKICKKPIELLEKVALIERNPYDRKMSKEELIRMAKDADILVVGNDRIDGEVMDGCERLRLIARHGIGIDNIDLKAATERGIIVTYTPQANSESVADFTIGLMISLSRKIIKANNDTKSGNIKVTEYIGTEVYKKTLGVIGLGAVGSRVAKRAKGFDMRVLAYDPYASKEVAGKLGVELVDKDYLLKESDFVTLHVPLTPETKGMIGERELKLMKETAFLINTSRGGVVDERALHKALEEGWIAGAALDVYVKETPDPDNPIVKLEGTITTPHIAAYTMEALCRMGMMITEDIMKFLNGERPINVANPEVFERR
ncbi:MAG: phosphoglycerate dehydrogenase [Candidatus Odinarchaeota archaeon]|nr:phosphoglycerate dehydrogenase [Candidatus Odinarchaeota archaeon]